MTMRSIFLLISILLLSAAWAVAQYENPDSDSQANASRVSMAGCLDGASGSYTLTDAGGAVYRLTGKTEQLKAHIGQTIRVTAMSNPVVNVPGSMSEGTQTLPTLSVISFKRLSGVCNFASNTP
jgi:hypothetical protein